MNTPIPAVLSPVLLLLGTLMCPSSARAQARFVAETQERERWHGEDNLYGEAYGQRIAMDEKHLVTAGPFKAVVWNLQDDQWHAGQVLEPGIGRIEDVAIHGEWIVFGSPSAPYGFAPPIDGHVSVFRNTGAGGWVEYQVWNQPDNAVTGYEVHSFGSSVDVSGDTLVVGAPDSRECCSGNTDGPGFVFIYTWNGAGWELVEHVTSDDSDPWRYFGASVDLVGDHLAVGAPVDEFDARPGEIGAAFIYEGSGSSWSEIHRIDPPDNLSNPPPYNFARHVANDYLCVAVAADEYVQIDCQYIPGHSDWEVTVIPLPGRRTSRSTDGLAYDLLQLLYLDEAHNEVVPIFHRPTGWGVQSPLPMPGVSSSPRGLAIQGAYDQPTRIASYHAAIGFPLEDAAGFNTGIVLTYYGSDADPQAPTELSYDDTLAFGGADAGDAFGIALDARQVGELNSVAIVGAPNDRRGSSLAGAAYFYHYNAVQNEWTKAERWRPEDLADDASFGAAVAIDGFSRAAAGAPRNIMGGQMLGSVHVRHEGSGELVLTPASPQELYGASVAYRDDVLIVGAPTGDGFQTESGVVYAYHYDDPADDWFADNRLAHPNSTAFAEFGASVGLDGDWMVAGSPGDRRDGLDAGAAYVYYRGATWIIAARLDPGDVTAGDRFGESVTIDGDVIVVGAPGDDSAGDETGAVYVFERIDGVWSAVQILTAGDARPRDHFGASLWLEGTHLFVGAPGVDGLGVDEGATYAFHRSGSAWIAATERIVHNSPLADDRAGRGVAFVHDMLLVGAEGEDRAKQDAGAVLVYDYESRVEVPSPLAPGAGGEVCRSDFEITFTERLMSPVDPAAQGQFASVLDVSGDTMAVGEPYAETTYINARGMPQVYRIGAVHILRRTALDDWTIEQTIFPPAEDVVPAQWIGNFGGSLSLDGDLLVVGNWYGKWVYVYERTRAGWVLRAKLLDPTPLNSTFGALTLAVSDTTVLVGEANQSGDGMPTGAGAVYFFERVDVEAWELNAGPLFSSEAHFGQHFGKRVALDVGSGWAVATGDRGNAGYRSAYLFERVGGVWEETTVLSADADGASSYFGRDSIALDGNTIVVGDMFYRSASGQTGGAFVWEFDGPFWNGPTVLADTNSVWQDHAGSGVAVDGDVVVVGALAGYQGDNHTPRTGVAYVYGRQDGAWSQRLRIAPDDTTLLHFGAGVGVSGGIAAVGTPRGSNNTGAGVAYAYDLNCLSLFCPGDFNSDGRRDLLDVAILQRTFGQTDSGHEFGDADGNGTIDFDDLAILVTNMGTPCP